MRKLESAITKSVYIQSDNRIKYSAEKLSKEPFYCFDGQRVKFYKSVNPESYVHSLKSLRLTEIASRIHDLVTNFHIWKGEKNKLHKQNTLGYRK